MIDLPIFFRVTSLALGQSFTSIIIFRGLCHLHWAIIRLSGTSDTALKNISKWVTWIDQERYYNRTWKKTNKGVCMFYGTYCIRGKYGTRLGGDKKKEWFLVFSYIDNWILTIKAFYTNVNSVLFGDPMLIWRPGTPLTTRLQRKLWKSCVEIRTSLQWRHYGRDSVSNHQPHDCLLKRLFRRKSKKTPKLRVTCLCAGNSPVTGEFPAQRASNAENVSIWWRHHGVSELLHPEESYGM